MSTIYSECMSFRIGDISYSGADNLPFRVWVQVAIAMIVLRIQKRRGRKHLMRLSDDQLSDIGMTRAEAEKEIRRSYPHWYFKD